MTVAEEQAARSGDGERFESGAGEYAAYLETVEGRLRLDLAWENFRVFAARHSGGGEGACALDLGCGPGALTLRLARGGWNVAAVDPSAAMLRLTEASARREGLADLVAVHQLEAEGVAQAFGPSSFDAVICHNVLEYVRDPVETAAAIGLLIRPGGIVSLVARNRAGEALRDAVRLHDLDSAERALTAESVRESLYGGPARLFDADSLRELATGAGLQTIAVRGVRVVADYLPPSLSDTPEAYARLLAFELRLGAEPDFIPVARYTQLLARASGN